MNFGVQRGLCNLNQDAPLCLRSDVDLQGLEDLQRLVLGDLKAFGDNPGMETLANVQLSLFEEFSDQENSRCGSITSDVILKSENISKWLNPRSHISIVWKLLRTQI